MKKNSKTKKKEKFDKIQFVKNNYWWILLLLANLILLVSLTIDLITTDKRNKEQPKFIFNAADFEPKKQEPINSVSVVPSLDIATNNLSEVPTDNISADHPFELPEIDKSDSEAIDQLFVEEEAENSFLIEEKRNLLNLVNPASGNYEGKWQIFLIQNKRKIDFIDSAILSNQSWKYFVNPTSKLIVQQQIIEQKGIFSSPRKKKFALQLLSLESEKMESAVKIVKMLVHDGYYAYLFSTENKLPIGKYNKQFFYRVRIGFFEEKRDALNAGREIVAKYSGLNLFTENYWVVLPKYEETNGELVDFVVQRNKPWLIQLKIKELKNEAIDNLRIIASLVDFTYIAQKTIQKDKKFAYRVRVGFFEHRQDAVKTLQRLNKEALNLFNEAIIIRIKNIQGDTEKMEQPLLEQKAQEDTEEQKFKNGPVESEGNTNQQEVSPH